MTVTKKTLTVALLAALFGGLFAGTTSAKSETLVFTAIPDEDESRLRMRFTKVARYLSEQLGVAVKFVPVKSYAAAITAFRNNQIQLAWFGGLSGVRARALVKGSRALAQGAEDKAFVSYFIAHASTELSEQVEFPRAIAGKTFTFGSKGSTSGRLMPEFHIRKVFGLSPDKVFNRVGFSGDHSRTIALVQSGAYEVGVVNFKVWENELKAGKIDNSRIRIIWRTPPYPDYQWTIRGDVDQRFGKGFSDKVGVSLLSIKDPALLRAFPRSAFIPAKNSDYAMIEQVGKSIGLID